MSIITAMVEQRRLAAHARCRVKCWHVNELQAQELADFLSGISLEFGVDNYMRSQTVFEQMKAGKVHALGARVHVRAAE